MANDFPGSYEDKPSIDSKSFIAKEFSWGNASIYRLSVTLICLAITFYICFYFGSYQYS